MPSVIDENTQFVDESTGELISNGYIYIGSQNQDAKLNPITIYSDRGLNTTLANPQRTGADGRSVNKIWVPGKYSMKIEDSDNVQKLNDLDLGETAQIGNTSLDNVQGINDITATASPTITKLVDKQTFLFTAVSTNTGAMTLTIDSTPQLDIVKNHDEPMESGDIEADQIVMVAYNETDNNYAFLNKNERDFLRTPVTKNENYTFVLSDINSMFIHDDSSNYSWTIPPNSTTAFSLGSVIYLKNTGSGVITVTRGSGVVLYFINGRAVVDANVNITQGESALLEKVGTDTWHITVNNSNEFKGALVKLTSNQSPSAATSHIIDWDEEVHDTDGFWEGVTNPDRITIPSGLGITKVSVRFNCEATGGATNSINIRVLKNNLAAYDGKPIQDVAPQSGAVKANVVALSIPVTDGDYFQFQLNHSSSSSPTFSTQSYAELVVVD